jgi:methylmalonyl-CoA/ethylmalonyl-CoA epimerase
VTSTLAPGTSLLFTLTEANAETGTTSQATVQADGTATVPFSFFTFDAEQAYTITVSAEGTAALNQSWSGETVAQQTATTTATATQETTTATDGRNAAESTETTSTDGPGFGAVAMGTVRLSGAVEETWTLGEDGITEDDLLVHDETDENRGMRFVFLDLGNGYLELIEPLGDGGSIATYLESDGPGIHHLAFATDDASAALDRARESGIQTLDDEPRPGAWGHDIAFLHPRDTAGVLVEFVEH